MTILYRVGEKLNPVDMDEGETFFNKAEGTTYIKDRNGFIIPINTLDISGETPEGMWTKFGDGTLIQRGEVIITPVKNQPSLLTFDLPIAFNHASNYTVTFIALTSRPDIVKNITSTNATTGSVNMYLLRSSATTTTVRWMAVGRWKD